jgi:hypothetical protein
MESPLEWNFGYAEWEFVTMLSEQKKFCYLQGRQFYKLLSLVNVPFFIENIRTFEPSIRVLIYELEKRHNQGHAHHKFHLFDALTCIMTIMYSHLKTVKNPDKIVFSDFKSMMPSLFRNRIVSFYLEYDECDEISELFKCIIKKTA